MEFKILGPLEVRDGRHTLAFRGRKQRLLLGVLLIHANEVVSSDALLEALWGESPPDTAAKALQVHVSQLRKLLEPERARGGSGSVIVTRPHGYELRVEPGQLDLHRFEEAVSQARAAAGAGRSQDAATALREGLGLWRGPPLADLTFEAPLQTELARFEELRLSAVEDRIEADLELGRHAEVVAELEALVAAHPLRERLRGQFMLALYRSGRQAEALEAYRDTRRALVDELGIEPGRALKELESAMLAQDASLETAPPPGEAPAAPTLVGRERELVALLPVIDGALAGHGAVVLVAGEPGIGKSRLAEALAGHAQQRGARVLVGRCWEAGGAPAYWPWVQALRSYTRDVGAVAVRAHARSGAQELATILPELRELLPDDGNAAAADSEGSRFRLFESVASFLRSAAAEQPLTLVLDDLHAADAPSLLLLRFVAGELRDAPLSIVGCYRDTEVGPELAEALPELSREAAAHRVSLRGLDRADTGRLLEQITGEPPADDLAARVHEETEGNPLFAGEVGRLLADEGPQAAGLHVPEGIREAIGRRLQGQSDECRRVLVLASVLGREFDLDLLERLAGLSQDELFAALEEAMAARLVGEVPGAPGRLRFSHVLVRDALYEDLPATRRLRAHQAAAEAIESLHAANLGAHLAELAHHYLSAGRPQAERAILYATRAGDRAASQLAYEEAARHYAAALHLLETTGPGDPGDRGELLLSLGEVLSRAGSGRESKDALRRAAALAIDSGRPDQLARAALGYGGRFVWTRASTDPELVPLLERGLAAVGEEDSPERVKLLTRLASASRDDADRARRARLAEEAIAMARRLGDPATLAYALDGGYTALEGPLNVRDRLGNADEFLALARSIGDKERAYVAHDYRLHVHWALGDRAGIDVELAAMGQLAEELRQPVQRWHLSGTRTTIALMEGDLSRAEELIARTAGLGGRAYSWNAGVTERLSTFVLRRQQGRLAEIEDTMTRAVHEYRALPRFRCALAHLYAELGREREARSALDELLATDLAREHLDAEWLFAVNLLPDVAGFLGDPGRAGHLYEVLLPHHDLYSEAPVEAPFGSMARGLGVLATTLGRLDEAERHFELALDLEHRMRARPWLAHVQQGLATMLLERGAAGDRERAADLIAEATATYRELGMGSWADRAAALPSAA